MQIHTVLADKVGNGGSEKNDAHDEDTKQVMLNSKKLSTMIDTSQFAANFNCVARNMLPKFMLEEGSRANFLILQQPCNQQLPYRCSHFAIINMCLYYS